MVALSPSWRRVMVVAAALALSLVLSWLASDIFERVNERSTDLIWASNTHSEVEQRLLVVDIDDQSLADFGPWPWSPGIMARLVDQLRTQGANMLLFDVVFPQSREGSARLAAALAASDDIAPAVLGQLFALRGESRLHMGEPVGALPGQGCLPTSLSAQGTIANHKGLHNRAGHITPTIDADGTVRRVPALVCYQGAQYPALAMTPFSVAEAPVIKAGQTPWQPAWQIQWPQSGWKPVGMDAQGQVRVPYTHSRRSQTAISAADVLRGRVPQGMLEGKWVLVGASAFGLSDSVPTALDPAVSGVEVHAQLVRGILDGTVPHTPIAAPWLQGIFVVVGTLLLYGLASAPPLSSKRRVVLVPLVAMTLALLAYACHGAALLQWQWYLGWAVPAFHLLMVGGALGVAEHAASLHVKGRLFGNLASYIPQSVAQEIALNKPSDDIQAQRANVTVLAADVRNFSAYCEARSPEDTARVLHRFYKTANQIITKHGGVVEEMVGDSLLAVFNGSQPCTDHPQQALSAALEIWARCGEELPNTSGRGLEPLAIGVGIETGTALVGSFGDADRRVHTVLGQTVTLALRLCDMTADLSYPVLVGQGAAHHLPPQLDQPETILKPLGSFLLPGLRQGTKIYTPKQMLESNSLAEQENLQYIRQQHSAA